MDKVLDQNKTVLLLAHFFLGYTFLYPLIFSHIPNISENGYLWAVAIFTFVVTLLICKDVLLQDGKQFLRKPQLLKLLGMLLSLLLLSAVSSVAVSYLTGKDTSGNQEAIIETLQNHRYVTIFMTVVMAPVVEECVFRYGIYRYLKAKNKTVLGIVLSAILFGLCHILADLLTGDWTQLYFSLPYIVVGLVFAFSYEKTDNLWTAIYLHFLYNLLGVLLIL